MAKSNGSGTEHHFVLNVFKHHYLLRSLAARRNGLRNFQNYFSFLVARVLTFFVLEIEIGTFSWEVIEFSHENL